MLLQMSRADWLQLFGSAAPIVDVWII